MPFECFAAIEGNPNLRSGSNSGTCYPYKEDLDRKRFMHVGYWRDNRPLPGYL